MKKKPTLNDYCQEIFNANRDKLGYKDGFYFLNKMPVTRKEMEKELSDWSGLYEPSKVDILMKTLERTIFDIEPKKAFFKTIKEDKKINELPFFIEFFIEKYPQYNWIEIFNSMILGSNEYIFILQGKPKSGKSLLVKFLSFIFGEFVLSMNLKEMLSNYGLSNLNGKFFIVGDDNGETEYLGGENLGTINSLITGATVSARQIFKEHANVVLNGNILMVFNELPKFEMNDGLLRRIIIIKDINHPFNYETYKDFINKKEALNLLNYLRNKKKYIDDYWDKTYMRGLQFDSAEIAKRRSNIAIISNMSPLENFKEYEIYKERAFSMSMRPVSYDRWCVEKSKLERKEYLSLNYYNAPVEDDELPF